jgi:hypothetical protein
LGGGRSGIGQRAVGAGDAAEGGDVGREIRHDEKGVEAGEAQGAGEHGGGEDVVMEAAVFGIAEGALAELLGGAGGGVEVEVVEGEDLVEVGEVGFGGVGVEVRGEVIEGGIGAAMVEGVDLVGEEEEGVAGGLEDATPLAEGFEGIGEVLEDVGGEQQVVVGIGDGGEVGGVVEEGAAGPGVGPGRGGGVELGPDGGGGVVAVVEGGEEGVDGGEKGVGLGGGEDEAGAADFEGVLAGEGAADAVVADASAEGSGDPLGRESHAGSLPPGGEGGGEAKKVGREIGWI